MMSYHDYQIVNTLTIAYVDQRYIIRKNLLIFGCFGMMWAGGNPRQLPLLSPLSFLFGLHGRPEPGVPAEHTQLTKIVMDSFQKLL